jgi:hypothetical protein
MAPLIVLAGCAVRPAPQAPVTVVLAEAAPASERQAAGNADSGGVVLVWGTPEGGSQTTWHVAEDGTVVREERGIVVATQRGEWRWVTVDETLETTGCEGWDGAAGEPGDGRGTRAELVLGGGSARQGVIAPPAEDGVQEIDHSVQVLGSVGPYLFLRESSYVYSCGAHGFTSAAFTVWDVDRGEAVDLLGAVPGARELQGAAAKILDQDQDDAFAAAQDEESAELVQIAPSYSPRGWLRLSAQFARAACYACSDGEWASYSRSATVPMAGMPARLAPWAAPPPGVQAFLSRRPEIKMGGWSRASQPE